MKETTLQGASLKNNKTSFCVHAPNAKKVELSLFSEDEQKEIKIPMQKDEEGCWHKELDGNLEGQKYGYRADGQYNPDELLFFNPNKLLVDPYAFEITKSLHNITTLEKEILQASNPLDSASVAPKSIVRFLDKNSLSKKYPYLYKKILIILCFQFFLSYHHKITNF